MKTFRRASSCLAFLGIGILMAGCAASGPKATAQVEDIIAKESQAQQEIKQLNEKIFASMSSAPQLQDYLISEGDLIQVSVFEAQELNTEVRVGARGFVTLPLIGSIELKGLTNRLAEQRIEDAYRQKYIQDPHVSIFVKEQLGNKIVLVGAVKNPGTHPYPARRGILDVLAMAGGLSDKAGRIVQVTRTDADDPNKRQTFLIDLDELIAKAHLELNIPIEGGDVIFVPEAGVVYVDGAVRSPGSYSIKPSMTVQEAIVGAGGFGPTADLGDVKLVRYVGNGKREVVKLSQDDIRVSAGGSAQDLKVKDRDVIFVETSTSKALLYGLRLNLGSGLVGVGYTPLNNNVTSGVNTSPNQTPNY